MCSVIGPNSPLPILLPSIDPTEPAQPILGHVKCHLGAIVGGPHSAVLLVECETAAILVDLNGLVLDAANHAWCIVIPLDHLEHMTILVCEAKSV